MNYEVNEIQSPAKRAFSIPISIMNKVVHE